MTQFRVTTRVSSTPELLRSLERAAARLRGSGRFSVLHVEVLEAEPELGVRIEVLGGGRSAARAAEKLFEELWYDAFGDRGVAREIRALDA